MCYQVSKSKITKIAKSKENSKSKAYKHIKRIYYNCRITDLVQDANKFFRVVPSPHMAHTLVNKSKKVY